MAELKGESNKKKTNWIDGLALLSGLLLMAGGACFIAHWIIDYRLVSPGL
ncbi:MAG: hypothetical protein WBB65_02745 [Anaerolineales bacterium]